jgi:hypothetical protein
MNFGNVYRPGWNCAARPALASTHAVMFTSNDRWPIFTPAQATIGSAPCELRLSMCLPVRLELRRNATPRDGESTRFTPTVIARHRGRRRTVNNPARSQVCLRGLTANLVSAPGRDRPNGPARSPACLRGLNANLALCSESFRRRPSTRSLPA